MYCNDDGKRRYARLAKTSLKAVLVLPGVAISELILGPAQDFHGMQFHAFSFWGWTILSQSCIVRPCICVAFH
eukprot:scaffold64378_cov16-Prasinocladus_malaysianus.AAC.1